MILSSLTIATTPPVDVAELPGVAGVTGVDVMMEEGLRVEMAEVFEEGRSNRFIGHRWKEPLYEGPSLYMCAATIAKMYLNKPRR